MELKYFSDISTIDELEARYRNWAKKLHPDAGGSNREFQDMNDEYKKLKLAFEILPAIKQRDIDTKKSDKVLKLVSKKRKKKIVQSFGELGRNIFEAGMEIITKRV